MNTTLFFLIYIPLLLIWVSYILIYVFYGKEVAMYYLKFKWLKKTSSNWESKVKLRKEIIRLKNENYGLEHSFKTLRAIINEFKNNRHKDLKDVIEILIENQTQLVRIKELEKELILSQTNVKALEKERFTGYNKETSDFPDFHELPNMAEDSDAKNPDSFSVAENGEIKYRVDNKTLDFNYDDPDFPRT